MQFQDSKHLRHCKSTECSLVSCCKWRFSCINHNL